MSSMPGEVPPLALVNGSDIHAICAVGANLLFHMVKIWYRSKAKVNRLLHNIPPAGCSTGNNTRHLPYEITEMIIAHLIHDIRTLKVCSLTCRSWYIITVPHIHHTLILGRGYPHSGLKPLFKLHGLGLIPLVQEIRVERLRGVGNWFLPQGFGRHGLRYFSAFANVHTLGLQRLEICRFFPRIGRYFGQFSPTLRSIVLLEPRCTPQQLSQFLSIFSNLDDIKIWGLSPFAPVHGVMPVPFSKPKPGGLLVLGGFRWVETWTHFIASCGGLQFRRMELYTSVSCAPVLLEACTNTLETLRFNTIHRSQGKSFCMDLSTGFS